MKRNRDQQPDDPYRVDDAALRKAINGGRDAKATSRRPFIIIGLILLLYAAYQGNEAYQGLQKAEEAQREAAAPITSTTAPIAKPSQQAIPKPVTQQATPAPKPVTQQATPAPKPVNIANDRLLALPKDQQAVMLGQVVGEGCIGKLIFYRGIGKTGLAKDKAYWAVRCANGKSYMVEISPDARGSTSVLDCPILKAVGIDCFKKL